MCELFAMSARLPATVNLSLEEFARHGGETAQHRHGWGIAYFDDGDARLLKEAAAASDSAFMDFVEGHKFKSSAVISHIRRATQGNVALKNTHPFIRELGGRAHIFAHNGNLAAVCDAPNLTLGTHLPIGDTDSEYAFCVLLHRMADLWKNRTPPPLAKRHEVVTRFADDIRKLGPANFLYGDGDVIFVHADRRTQADGEIKPPGLHILQRACAMQAQNFDAGGLRIATPDGQPSSVQEAVLIASVPLTDEAWRPLGQGEVLVLSAGELCPV